MGSSVGSVVGIGVEMEVGFGSVVFWFCCSGLAMTKPYITVSGINYYVLSCLLPQGLLHL